MEVHAKQAVVHQMAMIIPGRRWVFCCADIFLQTLPVSRDMTNYRRTKAKGNFDFKPGQIELISTQSSYKGKKP